MMNNLRDTLFEEKGLWYPPFHFIVDDEMRPGTFAFRINHLTTLPMVGLTRDQCLVNDTSKHLAKADPAVRADPATTPASRAPGAIVSATLAPSLEAKGLTTWTQATHWALCLADALRRFGPCLIDRRITERHLAAWDVASPKLTAAVRSRFSEAAMTRIMRGLLAEAVPIRNLRAILESLLDCDPTSGFELALAHVRRALRKQLAAVFSGGTMDLVVYLAEPELEELACRQATASPRDERAEDAILGALRREMDNLRDNFPTASRPHLLVVPESRSAVRDVIALEFPRVAVLSCAELPGQLNLQPVARLEMEAGSGKGEEAHA